MTIFPHTAQLVGRTSGHDVYWLMNGTPHYRPGLYAGTADGYLPIDIPPPSTDARGGYALASQNDGLYLVNSHPPGPGTPILSLWLPERLGGQQFVVGSRLVAWLNFEAGTPNKTRVMVHPRYARAAIVEAIKRGQGVIDYVRQMPEGTKVDPEEIYIEALGCWTRTDGSTASFDMGRGYVSFDASDACAIRAACTDWSHRAARPASLDDPA